MMNDEMPPPGKKTGWANRIDNLLTRAESLNTRQINELKEQLPDIERANEWADFVDQRIKVLGDTLRAEMQQAYAAHQQAMKANAILQWIATAGLLVAYIIRQLWNHF